MKMKQYKFYIGARDMEKIKDKQLSNSEPKKVDDINEYERKLVEVIQDQAETIALLRKEKEMLIEIRKSRDAEIKNLKATLDRITGILESEWED